MIWKEVIEPHQVLASQEFSVLLQTSSCTCNIGSGFPYLWGYILGPHWIPEPE